MLAFSWSLSGFYLTLQHMDEIVLCFCSPYNSGFQGLQQMSLPTEPSNQPLVLFLTHNSNLTANQLHFQNISQILYTSYNYLCWSSNSQLLSSSMCRIFLDSFSMRSSFHNTDKIIFIKHKLSRPLTTLNVFPLHLE